MDLAKYLIYFLIFFIIIYLFYYIFVVSIQIRVLKGKTKNKKKKNLPAEILLLRDYYKIDVDKVGLVKILRILNFINAFFLSLLVTVVLPIEKVYLKILVLVLLIFPTIWFVYYFLAKYLKHLERREN